jgi:hypothetical protein
MTEPLNPFQSPTDDDAVADPMPECFENQPRSCSEYVSSEVR